MSLVSQLCLLNVSVASQQCLSCNSAVFQLYPCNAMSQYCLSTASELYQYCLGTVSVLSQHRLSTVSALYQHCIRTVSALSQNCISSSISALLQWCKVLICLSLMCQHSLMCSIRIRLYLFSAYLKRLLANSLCAELSTVEVCQKKLCFVILFVFGRKEE